MERPCSLFGGQGVGAAVSFARDSWVGRSDWGEGLMGTAKPFLDRVRAAIGMGGGRLGDRYVFLLSHMRSYSSLLAHVLGSHPELCGYLESGLSYRRPSDLRLLGARLEELGTPLHGRYRVDKLLHDNYRLAPAALEGGQARLVFFVRRPVDTLASISHMARFEPGSWYANPEAVTNYYCRRLQTLADLAHVARAPRFWFPAERLIDDPEPLLAALSAFLELRTPLSPNYQVQAKTGQLGFGDPSPRIREGRILREAGREAPALPPDFSTPQLARCDGAYSLALTSLRANCQTV